MKKRRAKNLSDADIKQIVEILDGWLGKLTWGLLINAIELSLFYRYTRQTLFKHERIRNAFEVQKKNLSRVGGQIVISSPELKVALETIERLKKENIRLESENQRLLEQFAAWAYNAHARGLDYEFLSHPLPGVNRGQTILSKKLD
ncbi:MAG: hypothetical protein CVU71_10355 [Deltaproteobacteria bacterium HGW-Deltaproteobacteria-6]|nr:MAG: hypothetical protein CVU71_10355 [Deltaproteobacteria bacterium HGW-Deltaproteobacteria-6]